MAAIDIVGNTVIVTAAGTMDVAYPNIEIGAANVWWVSTLGDIQIVDMNTGTTEFIVDGDEVNIIHVAWNRAKRLWERRRYDAVPIKEARQLWQDLVTKGYERF